MPTKATDTLTSEVLNSLRQDARQRVRDTALQVSIKLFILLRLYRKPHRTYRRVLESAYVGVLWSMVAEQTGAPGENHRP